MERPRFICGVTRAQKYASLPGTKTLLRQATGKKKEEVSKYVWIIEHIFPRKAEESPVIILSGSDAVEIITSS